MCPVLGEGIDSSSNHVGALLKSHRPSKETNCRFSAVLPFQIRGLLASGK